MGIRKTIQTPDGSTYQTANLSTYAGAYLAGGTAGTTLSLASNKLFASEPWIKAMRKQNIGIDRVEISNALDKALDISKIKEKGVKIIDYSGQKTKSTKEIFMEYINSMEAGIPRNIQNDLAINTVKEGKNSFYFFKPKEIHINIEKFGLLGFHEIGHAINQQSSKFWHIMQKSRIPMGQLAGLFSITALLKRKKAEGEEYTGTFDKVTTFIKENVGKLTTLTFIPVIAEELKASSRGNKLAKQVLSPELAKRVAKTNKYGAITYIATAMVAGLTAYTANKVRDAISAPKKIETDNKPNETEY